MKQTMIVYVFNISLEVFYIELCYHEYFSDMENTKICYLYLQLWYFKSAMMHLSLCERSRLYVGFL